MGALADMEDPDRRLAYGSAAVYALFAEKTDTLVLMMTIGLGWL